jgi:4-hydroxy-tetrahydrodipicolinate reductase
MHHHHKKDAPSGTAERLIEILKEDYELSDGQVVHGREGLVGARPQKEIGVHAIRGGDIVGEHTVYFIGDGERVELTHKASDRKIFAQGRRPRGSVGTWTGTWGLQYGRRIRG